MSHWAYTFDLALNVRRSSDSQSFSVSIAAEVAMRFLERRVAELSTTVRISEERTGGADPYRRAALAAASELRDELARGSERLFDVTLAFTVWTRGTSSRSGPRASRRSLRAAHFSHVA